MKRRLDRSPTTCRHARRNGESGEGDCTEVPTFEQARDKASGGIGNDDGVWFCDRLQPRREVGRFAQRRLLACSACIHKFAHHDETGRDADARMQALREHIETGDIGDKCKRRMHGALRIVFVDAGITEIGERTIAHVPGDEAAEAFNGLSCAAVIRADDLPQILGIESGGEQCRSDQIAEHDGELAALDRRCVRLRSHQTACRRVSGRHGTGLGHGEPCAAFGAEGRARVV